jgi:hypothetical protein
MCCVVYPIFFSAFELFDCFFLGNIIPNHNFNSKTQKVIFFKIQMHNKQYNNLYCILFSVSEFGLNNHFDCFLFVFEFKFWADTKKNHPNAKYRKKLRTQTAIYRVSNIFRLLCFAISP